MADPPTDPTRHPDDNLSRLLVPDMEVPWFRSLLRNIKEAINPPRLAPFDVTSKPVAVKDIWGLEGAPWYRGLIRNIKDAINPPRLPPLEVTSKPAPVKDIWGLYRRDNRSFLYSSGLQVTVVALLFTLGTTKQGQMALHSAVTVFTPIDTAPPEAPPKKQMAQGGGGGGAGDPLPASKGKLPKPMLRQFTPPEAVLTNLNPKLPMEPTIIAPPDTPLPNISAKNYGDPFGKNGPLSNGVGSSGGIGSGDGGGVGPGKGPGFGPGENGGFGGNYYQAGGGVTAPTLLSKVEPEYSEEARKAKYSGLVVLAIVVMANGQASNVRVQQSLGLGLDEKAIEAVKKWRFNPGKKDGQAVPVAATIVVSFRLL
jgi:periplasmic protein TonB